MNIGMTFVADLYEFDTDKEYHVLCTPGDYIRTCEWTDENQGEENAEETVYNLKRTYALVWHALKRRGKLEEMSLPAVLDNDGIVSMADRFSAYLNEVEGGSLPLAVEGLVK